MNAAANGLPVALIIGIAVVVVVVVIAAVIWYRRR